jgi:RNA polymerase sigma-70 factor (ECF subfamily)
MNETWLAARVAAARSGSEEGFRELVEALARPLLAAAYRYTRDWHRAQDLCQETWLRVHLAWHRYDPQRPFLPWLYAIHRHGCLAFLQRRARQPVQAVTPEEVERRAPAVAANPGEAELAAEHFHQRLLGAVARLGSRQRDVFTRVDLENGDQRAVAEELGLNPTTLRTTLHHARRRLAQLLHDGEEEE